MDEIIKYSTPSKVSRYWDFTVYMNDNNIYFSNPIYKDIPENKGDQYFMVTQKYVDRIDLISAKFYNNVILWWVIAKANNLSNPMSVPLDTILRIPAKATLYGEGGLVSGS
jgi:hypothetical protein